MSATPVRTRSISADAGVDATNPCSAAVQPDVVELRSSSGLSSPGVPGSTVGCLRRTEDQTSHTCLRTRGRIVKRLRDGRTFEFGGVRGTSPPTRRSSPEEIAWSRPSRSCVVKSRISPSNGPRWSRMSSGCARKLPKSCVQPSRVRLDRTLPDGVRRRAPERRTARRSTRSRRPRSGPEQRRACVTRLCVKLASSAASVRVPSASASAMGCRSRRSGRPRHVGHEGPSSRRHVLEEPFERSARYPWRRRRVEGL